MDNYYDSYAKQFSKEESDEISRGEIETNVFADSVDEINKKHRDFLESIGAENVESITTKNSSKPRYHRVSHCYNCKTTVDNHHHLECSCCYWIICPSCGACGAGFVRY